MPWRHRLGAATARRRIGREALRLPTARCAAARRSTRRRRWWTGRKSIASRRLLSRTENRGDPAAALRRLEAWVARAGRGTGPADLAALRLEAARLAVAAEALDDARAHLAEAERLGDPARAEPLLAAALADLASGPAEAAEAANAFGAARIELLRPREAVAAFGRALEILGEAGVKGGQPVVAAFANLANARVEAGEPDAARAAADRARAAAGGDPELSRTADYALAQAKLREPYLPGAETVLETLAGAPRDEPVRGHALALLANSRFDRGRMPEAAEAWFAALEAYRASVGERHPAFGRVLHTLGNVHAELGDSAPPPRSSSAPPRSSAPPSVPVQPSCTRSRSTAAGSISKAATWRPPNAAPAAFRTVPPPDCRLGA